VRGRAFEYLFYADIAIRRDDLQCTRALVHLAEFARSMRSLGSYVSWKEPEATRESGVGNRDSK
jgi:prephenate dehydratase